MITELFFTWSQVFWCDHEFVSW